MLMGAFGLRVCNTTNLDHTNGSICGTFNSGISVHAINGNLFKSKSSFFDTAFKQNH